MFYFKQLRYIVFVCSPLSVPACIKYAHYLVFELMHEHSRVHKLCPSTPICGENGIQKKKKKKSMF